MTDVFISYSRKDEQFVQVLNQALVKSKYDAWVDWENTPLRELRKNNVPGKGSE